MPEFSQLSPLTVTLTALSVFLASFVATFIIVLLIRGIGQARNSVPRQTVPATVVGKRQDDAAHYVTFDWDGKRAEVAVSGAEYGLLAEGDAGELTFQGTRYLGFVRA